MFLAALATPLVLGVVLSVLLWLKLGLSLDARELGVVALNGLFAVYSLPVSLLVAAAIGLPLAMRLERRGERSASTPAVAALCGAASNAARSGASCCGRRD